MFALGDLGPADLPGLSKLVEECGEVMLTLGKLVRILGKLVQTRGAFEYWGGVDLKAELEDELGDVYAGILFALIHWGLDRERVEKRATEKLAKYKNWHREGGVPG